MLTLSDKYKAFGAAVIGLAMVVLAQFVKDPTVLAAIGGVLSTAVVYTVANRPT
jgi:drug/metabolite transporter (DMT)-like permease